VLYRRARCGLGIGYYTVASIPSAWRRDRDASHYALRWFASLLPGRSPLADGVPWLPYCVVEWLEATVTPAFSIFEYGSGGSTLYWARRAQQVVSIEHDRAWHARVAQVLAQQGIDNCTYRLIEPEPCASVTASVEQNYRSTHPAYRDQTFARYVHAIDTYADASLDLILIDGRARLACARQAACKVKPGGFIVLDNTDRAEYAPAGEVLAGMARIDLAGILPYGRPHWGKTSIWQRPFVPAAGKRT
jgi:hypothetical protein